MKSCKFILSVNYILATLSCSSQVLSNNGAVIDILSSTVITAGSIANSSGTIANAGTITLSADFTNGGTTSGNGIYNIGGNWSNTGTFTAGTSTANFNGTLAQTIGGTSVTTFNNLTISNSSGVSITSAQSLIGTLTLAAGVFTTTGQTFTLLSNSSATARIADLTGGGSITGNITMERFTLGSGAGTNYTGWAFIGSPVTGRTLADWDDDIIIYCPSGCPDGPIEDFNSVYTYNEAAPGESDQGYVPLTDINDAIATGEGRWVYLGNGTIVAGDITIDVTGPPITGDQNLPVTYTDDPLVDASKDGWNLIANPYPSPISWTSLEANASVPGNIDNTIYVFNADLNGGLGEYATYIIGGASSPLEGSGGIGDNIPSCQGFYVHLTGSTTLQAKESHKTSSNPTFLKTAEDASDDVVFRLYLDGGSYHTETVFRFMEEATNGFDSDYDAYKLFSGNPLAPSICSKMDGNFYAINSLPLKKTQEVSVPVRVKVGVTGIYTISLADIDTSFGSYCLKLEDLEVDSVIALKNSSYSFNLSASDIAEDPIPRFKLHFFMDTLLSSCEIQKNNNAPKFDGNNLEDQIKTYLSNSILKIEFLQNIDELDISIYNIVGQKVWHTDKINVKSNIEIDIAPYTNGVYLVNFVANNSVATKKINFIR